LSGGDLEGATIYTTLEPCLNRSEPKVSCVDRLISVKVARVVIGALDPDHRGNGIRKLVHSPTIEVAFFPPSLRAAARDLIQKWKEFSENKPGLGFWPSVITSASATTRPESCQWQAGNTQVGATYRIPTCPRTLSINFLES
jgi:hypothetical protein